MSPLPRYAVYKAEYHLAFQDPLMPHSIRYHTNIFIATDFDGSGFVHEVNGDITSIGGMEYIHKASAPPESIDSFYRKTLLGELDASNYQSLIDVLKGISPPPRQRWFNPRSMKMEACREDGKPYEEGEGIPRFWKCTEWTVERAIPALLETGLITKPES